MKRSLVLIALLALALTLTACGGTPAGTVDTAPETSAQPEVDAPESTPEAEAAAEDAPAEEAAPESAAESVTLETEYENALSPKLLLSLGTMELANTEYALTAEQAEMMLFYWQALNNMTASGNSATEEVAAILAQIEETFTPEQITAINQMQMTTETMQIWAEQKGVTMGAGAGGGQGQGGGSGMDPEARATRQAEEGVTGDRSGGLSAAINDALIEYLQSVQ